MKCGQLIECDKRNFLFKNHAENEAGRLVVPDLFLFNKKALYEVKVNGLQLSVSYFDSPQFDIQ